MSKNTEKAIKRIKTCLDKIGFGSDVIISKQYLDYITNAQNNSRLLEDIINAKDLTREQKSDACFKSFLVKEDIKFLYKAADLSSKYSFTGWVAHTMVNKDDNRSHHIKSKIGHKFDAELSSAFFSNLGITEEDIVFFADLIPPQIINEFYSVGKTQLQISKNVEKGWYSDSIKITYKDVENYYIKDFNGCKLYGYIPEKYDSPTWQQAASKGFAKGRYGKNGFKLENGVLELKANEDARLYTIELHKNDLGDYLAVLDKKAGHPEISRIISQTESIFINEDCHSQIENTLLGDSHYEVCEA